MKILFATDRPYLPQTIGGSERSTHELCIRFMCESNSVAVLAALSSGDLIWLKNRVRSRLSGRRVFPSDSVMGYPVFRGWRLSDGIRQIVAEYGPDMAIVQASGLMRLGALLIERDVPCLLYVRNVDSEDFSGSIDLEHPGLRFVANSTHTALELKRRFDIDAPGIPPLVDPKTYRVESRRERVVLVNPTKKKGVDIALRLAECRPDIPFDFVESWNISDSDWRVLRSQAMRLGNITLRRRVSDMRQIYRRAKLVLMPSILNEAWGRVATEAQLSGIPLLASDRGGLPEAVGPGGILIGPEADLSLWQEALSRLWDNPVEYETFSRKASEYSKRPEIQPEFLIERLMSLMNYHRNQASGLDR